MESHRGFLIPAGSHRCIPARKPAPMAEISGGLTKTKYKSLISLLSINYADTWYNHAEMPQTPGYKALFISMVISTTNGQCLAIIGP